MKKHDIIYLGKTRTFSKLKENKKLNILSITSIMLSLILTCNSLYMIIKEEYNIPILISSIIISLVNIYTITVIMKKRNKLNENRNNRVYNADYINNIIKTTNNIAHIDGSFKSKIEHPED